MTSKTLSKSRFKLALECPTKVFYSLDKRYVNTKDDDEFLEALADGGFQVGALAKAVYQAEDPGAVEVTAIDQDAQVGETAALLERENVTIFEGTIRHGNCLARVDVLRKRGNVVELIEVKSKSYDPGKPKNTFRGANGEIRTGWLPYFRDVTFQTHVFRQVYPALTVKPSLLLVDPTVPCSVHGLGTAVRVTRQIDRHVEVAVDADFDVRQLDSPLLKVWDASEFVAEILASLVEVPGGAYGFDEFVDWMSTLTATGKRAEPAPGKQCKNCEYYCEPSVRATDRCSGWSECMETRFAGKGNTPRNATVFALYNHRHADELLAKGKLLLSELNDDDVGDDESRTEIKLAHRHRLQIKEAREGAAATLLRKHTLREAFAGWTFPLHFIDFETSRPTLPFTAGRRPNEQLLFQFSHHVLDAEGKLAHRTQCLVTEPGVVPNAVVVRALRDALVGDQGTVVHWWDHEKTVLGEVSKQLETGAELDKAELLDFICSLTGRRLFDLGRLVLNTAFIAGTDGRSSIKKVLQAVLSQSEYLRERYARPVYGTPDMPSLNFPAGWTWWRQSGGAVLDPYSLLGQIFPDPEFDAVVRTGEADETSEFVAKGGAAMVAYGVLQRTDLALQERQKIEAQLKRYCELDTLAMVMVYEALREWVSRA